jgi:hypothetical protein
MQAFADFHRLDHALSFANAAMLPLLGEKLAQSNKGAETLFIAACIITAQIVMVPMAILVGHKADSWGRKPVFLAGFAVLPIRGVLYTLTQNPYALVSIQVLDGIAAGIFGALFFIVIADLTRGTGRYNLDILGTGRRAQQFGCRLYCRQGRIFGGISDFGLLRVRRLAAAVDRDAGDRRPQSDARGEAKPPEDADARRLRYGTVLHPGPRGCSDRHFFGYLPGRGSRAAARFSARPRRSGRA